MQTVTKRIETEIAHRLIKYQGKCAHIHGHSYKWEVTVARAKALTAGFPFLDERGFVIDFAELKEVMKRHIFDRFDHTLILSEEDPLNILYSPISELFKATDGSPGRVEIVKFNPTAENMASFVAGLIQRDLGEDIRVLEVKVWETSNSYAIWQDDLENLMV